MNQTEELLAVAGGIPVRSAAFASWPHYAQDEIDAVTDVLASGRVNAWTGEACGRFEAAYARHADVRHAIALANGTLALELALIAYDIGPGDEVVVPSRTFIASASCVVARGAVPVVADIDADSQTLTADTIRAVLTPRTRAVVAVHLAGWPCDMDAIMALARECGLVVIEDCAQAHGARYRGRPVGSLGDAAAFSFCQDKIISTGGEGGMLLLNDTARWETAWAYKDHGKNYDAVYRREHAPGFRWLHESFGSNWRMTGMQAAIGLCQLDKLPVWVAQRQQHARTLAQGMAPISGLRLVAPPTHIEHAYYRYYAFLEPDSLKAGWDQTRIIAAIQAEGIPCFVGSCSEIARERAFVKAGWQPGQRLSVARHLGETSLAFLVHPTLDAQAMDDTCAAVAKVMRTAVR
ncbi:MAG: aminotransferase [Hydrogenophilales bacterium 16-64-46]|nr:MAG: aminotransferase [Hydrogenophilales bacterium 12-64-13]OYZ05559.1 MAG: aminotransferase [Hydrogenophilales bacterium 16-64-46]OZA40139.1 MAG: aminotransferase [Hydrogenophilales bacterium 17-64-34]